MMNQPITVTEAKEQFKAWRTNKPRGENIPERLWSIVDQILSNPNYNRSVVTKGLGVSTAQLRKKFPAYFLQNTLPAKKSKNINFVKASLTPLMTSTPLTSMVTIERHNGVKLSISTPTQEQFTAIIKSFME
jgi:hypothetical protein